MSDTLKSDDFSSRLTDFRKQIDAIDDKLIALLIERIGIINQVGEMKRGHFPGQCPIRAGREAEMVRRVMGKFEGTAFSPGAGAALWRTLIGASTASEGLLKISVYATAQDNDLYWLGREYFGPFIPSIKQPHANRVIGDIIDGKATIGIVPPPQRADTGNWWTSLIQTGSDAPKIFAHVPFVHYGTLSKDIPSGLAIAKIAPEPTGDDVSLLVIDADHNVSQHRLQTAFATAKMEATWVNIVALNPSARHHLVQVKGFYDAEHDDIKKLQAGLGGSVKKIYFLGAYATPLTIKHEQKHETTAPLPGKQPAKA